MVSERFSPGEDFLDLNVVACGHSEILYDEDFHDKNFSHTEIFRIFPLREIILRYILQRDNS